MTLIALQSKRRVNVAVHRSAGIAVGSDDHPLALAGDAGVDQALSLADGAPRAIALQVSSRTGMAFAGDRRFTAIGAVAGQRGKQGIPGPAGGAAVERVAGETISALRVVYELDGRVFALDYRDAEHIDLLLGVTLTAASAGAAVNVQRTGDLSDSGWAWQPGRIYLGQAGLLTQHPAETGYSLLIGSAVSATRILLNLQDPIELE